MDDNEYIAKNNLQVINPDGDTAICCLWYDLDRGDLQDFLREKVHNVFLVGNLYTLRGIPKLLAGVLRFPQINHLVIWGPDVQKTGKALYDQWFKKCDGYLSGQQLDYLRNNVEFTLVESRYRDVSDLHMFSYDKLSIPKRLDKIIIKEPEVKIPETMPSEITGWTIRTADAAQAWGELLQTCMRFGVVKESQHRARQKEILNVTITMPEFAILKNAKLMHVSEEELESYFQQTLSDELPEGLAYTPGYRLRGRWGDQLEKMIGNLQNTKYTRRAVANLWDSSFDHDNPNPPCFTQIGCNIVNEKLYMSVFARSNDLFAAWPLDVLTMTRLAVYISDVLSIGVGDLSYHITSAHIYEHDWENAEREILRSFVRRNIFTEDPRGNFIIELVSEKIHAYLIDPDGKEMIWEVFGEDSEEIMGGIIRNKMISRIDHAAYVSQELTKAGIFLQNNLKYNQGRA